MIRKPILPLLLAFIVVPALAQQKKANTKHVSITGVVEAPGVIKGRFLLSVATGSDRGEWIVDASRSNVVGTKGSVHTLAEIAPGQLLTIIGAVGDNNTISAQAIQGSFGRSATVKLEQSKPVAKKPDHPSAKKGPPR